MGKRAKRLERMYWRLARQTSTYRRALMKIANYDQEDFDPLHGCAIRQWANEALDKYGEMRR